MLDKGEQDDKLIAVRENTPFYQLESIKQLDEKYNEVTDIIKIWFSNYKGPEMIKVMGFDDAVAAKKFLDLAIKAYDQSKKNRR